MFLELLYEHLYKAKLEWFHYKLLVYFNFVVLLFFIVVGFLFFSVNSGGKA